MKTASPGSTSYPTEEILSNTDDAYETTLFTRTFELRNQPVAPGYEWRVDRLASAPSDHNAMKYTYTAKSYRIAAERENGGPMQHWPDLRELDEPILDSKVKGPPCQPRIKP